MAALSLPRRLGPCFLAAFALLAAPLVAQADDSIQVRAAAVPLERGEMARLSVGSLLYRGGIALSAPDLRFGGFSGLDVSADGECITAVTDHGDWLQARPIHDRLGHLVGLTEARMGRLTGADGRRLSTASRERDAESLTVRADGSALVSFERNHRLWLYPPSEPPFAQAPRVFPVPPGLNDAPANDGIEAVTELPDRRLLAIAEGLWDGPDHLVGWLFQNGVWQRLHYAVHGAYRPTDAKALPNGDVIVLERRYSMLGGFGARLRRVAAKDIVAGGVLRGEELAELLPPMTVDNMEGLAIRRGNGETLLYVIADDNFQSIQSTVLLLFALPD
jgi:hypothetical protein